MSSPLPQLLHDVAELTGATPPAWLAGEAPVLAEAEPFYLVGLIGGKDVGKSALVNALVGQPITAQTSFGPGTETVIAYAHRSQVAALQTILEAEVPGQFRIVEHSLPHLTRQVLLDLPDVDSHWGDHVTVTRKILRHLLFPVWVQSVEKYADRQPQELLARVAAGNAPGNFVFCLNKVDQVSGSRAAASVATQDPIPELQEDYAARIQRVLQLPAPPRVWAIAAVKPESFELPELRALLTQQKSDEAVRESRAQAAATQQASVLAWLTAQDLPGRAGRLQRLEDDADETVNERLGVPLLDGLLPKLLDDPGYRHALTDDCLAKCVGHWPILNVLHPIFAAIGGFLRRNAEAKARPLTVPTGEARVDEQLADLTHEGTTGRSLADRVQTTFALLQQTHPALSGLYRARKLWEPIPATEAAGALRDALVATLDKQRTAVCARAALPSSAAGALLRGVLTIGAVLWFPFVQPVVHTIQLNHAAVQPSDRRSLAGVVIELLSLPNFIQSLTGLLLYFTVLWLCLRWSTQRSVTKQFGRWKRTDGPDADLSLTARIVAWLGELVAPVRAEREKVEDLAARIGEVGKTQNISEASHETRKVLKTQPTPGAERLATPRILP